MTTRKIALAATTALAGTLLISGAAWAQSTGTQTVEEVVVTAQRTATVDGAIIAEKNPKSRSTITQEYIETQNPGQSVIQLTNLVPGVNFVNNDPFGSSGGNVRIRSFDGNRISLTWDGMPLNDTGNYAIFSNQLLAPELVSKVAVNLGTTDVDSPTASATGGTIAYTTRKPADHFQVNVDPAMGSFNFLRGFASLDTGPVGPFGTTALVAVEGSRNDWWRGTGIINKKQVNARLYQDMGDGDFMSVGFHYNQNRNTSSRSLTKAQIAANYFDGFHATCSRLTPTLGVADSESANTGGCDLYSKLAWNPSDTANIRGQASFHLAPNLRVTIDPSFQYVLATGGNESFTQSENGGQLAGTFSTSTNSTGNHCVLANGTVVGGGLGNGVDLNGDGDCKDTVRYYSPSVTNTHRYGLTTSAIWDINDNNRVRFSYTLDYGRHRQTGEGTFVDQFGNPDSVFGARDGAGRKIFAGDGTGAFLRFRDRLSIASLNQVAAEYVGHWMDGKLDVSLGLRAPSFQRDLDQHCYTQNNGSTAYCTSETPTLQADGNYKFPSSNNEYVAPFKETVHYRKLLPNVGAVWHLDETNSIYGSFAQGLSAPRTDNLYTVSRDTFATMPVANTDPATMAAYPFKGGAAAVANPHFGVLTLAHPAPEETKAYDLGYRHQSSNLISSVALWTVKYDNRIVSSFDDTTNSFVDRNIGTVNLWGIDAEAGYKLTSAFDVYGSVSFIHSSLAADTRQGTSCGAALPSPNPLGLVMPNGCTTANTFFPVAGTPLFLPTKGKKLVETPDLMLTLRGTYKIGDFKFGLQGKYVGRRYTTDVNDDWVNPYTLWDADVRYKLDSLGLKHGWLQLNIDNLFDKRYIGNISSQNNALTINGVKTGANPTFSPGSPRTAILSLKTEF